MSPHVEMVRAKCTHEPVSFDRKPMRAFLLLAIFFSFSVVAAAQSSDGSTPIIPGIGRDRRDGRDGRPENLMEEEMIQRAAIKRGEESHKEMVERAKENARLGATLKSAIDDRSVLALEDLKKLERMESLARKIRGESGGSDDGETVEDPPRDLITALKLLAETSDDLLKKVEKTSRLVTSASVVQRSNQVIQLIKHVKTLVRQ